MEKLPDSLGFLLADVMRLLRRDFAQRLVGSDINFHQARVLIAVSRQPGICQVVLAEQLELNAIALSRLIDQLAHRRLIERRPDPHDGRAHQLYLRSGASVYLATFTRIADAMRLEVLRDLDESELDAVTAGLEQIRANLLGAGPHKPGQR